jgi:hypothetical protein
MMRTTSIDLEADLNCEDDEGRWWSVLDWATDPSRIVPGAIVVAGRGSVRLVVRIDQVDDDGQVHFVEAMPDGEQQVTVLRKNAVMSSLDNREPHKLQ